MASANSSTSSADADGGSPAAAPPPASDSASPPPSAAPNWTLFLQAYMQKLAQLHEMESLAKQLLHHQQQQQLAASSPTRPPPDLKPPESIAVPSPLSPVEQLIAVNRIASLVPDAQCAPAATLLANTSLLAMLQNLQTMQETPQSPNRGLDSLLRARAPRAPSGAELKPFVSVSPFAAAQADAGPLLGGLLAALAGAPAANARANQPPPLQPPLLQPQQEQILAGLRATIERGGGGGAELVGLLALLLVRLLEANANASAPQPPAAAPDAAAAQQLCQALLACKQESADVHAGVGLDVKHNVGPARPTLDEVDRGPVFPPFGPRFSPPAAAPSIECVSCSRTFSSPQALGNHMKRCAVLCLCLSCFSFHLITCERCSYAGHTGAPRRARGSGRTTRRCRRRRRARSSCRRWRVCRTRSRWRRARRRRPPGSARPMPAPARRPASGRSCAACAASATRAARRSTRTS